VFTWFASGSVAARRAAAAHAAPSTDPTGTFGISTGTRPRSEIATLGNTSRSPNCLEFAVGSGGPEQKLRSAGARQVSSGAFLARVEKAGLERADTDTAQGAANAAEPAGGGQTDKSPAARRRLRPLRDEAKPSRRRKPVGPVLRTLPAVSQATVLLETAAKPRTADYAYYVSRSVLRDLLRDQPDSGMRRAASYAVRIRTRTRTQKRCRPRPIAVLTVA